MKVLIVSSVVCCTFLQVLLWIIHFCLLLNPFCCAVFPVQRCFYWSLEALYQLQTRHQRHRACVDEICSWDKSKMIFFPQQRETGVFYSCLIEINLFLWLLLWCYCSSVSNTYLCFTFVWWERKKFLTVGMMLLFSYMSSVLVCTCNSWEFK